MKNSIFGSLQGRRGQVRACPDNLTIRVALAKFGYSLMLALFGPADFDRPDNKLSLSQDLVPFGPLSVYTEHWISQPSENFEFWLASVGVAVTCESELAT